MDQMARWEIKKIKMSVAKLTAPAVVWMAPMFTRPQPAARDQPVPVVLVGRAGDVEEEEYDGVADNVCPHEDVAGPENKPPAAVAEDADPFEEDGGFGAGDEDYVNQARDEGALGARLCQLQVLYGKVPRERHRKTETHANKRGQLKQTDIPLMDEQSRRRNHPIYNT